MNRERMKKNKHNNEAGSLTGCRCLCLGGWVAVCVRTRFLGVVLVWVCSEKSAILTDFLTLDMHQEAHDSLI